MDAKSGFQRAVEAAWGKLPEIIITSLLASFVFLGSLWLADRDMRGRLDHIDAEQLSPRLCTRIGECGVCTRVVEGLARIDQVSANMDARFAAHIEERQAWRERTRRLEEQVYQLTARATAGSDTRALEDRIRQLERKP